jgi:sugar transferase (PEP-CTERM system associated)
LVRVFNVYFPVRTLALLAGEAVIIPASFLLATLIRLRGDSMLFLAYEQGGYKIALACGVFIVCMYYYDLYESYALCDPREITNRLILVLGTGCMVMALIYYVFPSVRLGLALFIPAMIFFGLSLALWRKMFLALNRSERLSERALILGVSPLANSLNQEIAKRREWGVQVVGYAGQPSKIGVGIEGCRYLGEIEELAGIVKRQRIGEIIVAMGERRGSLPVELLLDLKTKGVTVRDGADVYEAMTGMVPLESLRLSWLLFSPGFQLLPGRRVLKRALSLTLSLVGLVLTLPLMILTAIAVRLDSKGPVLFRQERVGQDGRIFKLNKFRSMKADSDPDKPAQTDDERFTRVGKWIRRARLDELPQLFNILVGDMSFVGPRPFVPSQEQELVEKIPFYRQRWTVKPGATGWAQIHRGYCATLEDNAEKLAYDLFYIKNMSVGLDLLIIFDTLKTLLLGRGGR